VFFVLSKILDLFLSPLTWALVFFGVGLFSLRRQRPARASLCVTIGALVLFVFSLEAVAGALVRSLESSSRTTMKTDETYDAVIVLGGMTDDEASAASGVPAYGDAIERLLVGFDVLRTHHAKFALLTGGSPRAGRLAEWNEARVLERQLEAWGIAKERLVVDEVSLNTRENAVESARIARERGWKKLLLITSAAHMERAAGCFRAQAVAFDTLAVDFHAHPASLTHVSWLPRADNLAIATNAIREYAGRVVYRTMGYAKDAP
jgi:uncharacterized SAM-binding protein YcdF (DUF218 family)